MYSIIIAVVIFASGMFLGYSFKHYVTLPTQSIPKETRIHSSLYGIDHDMTVPDVC